MTTDGQSLDIWRVVEKTVGWAHTAYGQRASRIRHPAQVMQ